MTAGGIRQVGVLLKKETVLCVAVVLAAVSMLFVPPSAAYFTYIDWDTLAMLFSLMAVVKGFQKAGLFICLGGCLLRRITNSRAMLLALVALPFVFSMLVTNDVALITFVPFGLIVLRLAGQERLVVPLVVLQTVAANLGSMLTPMGNPQNLYLYTRSGMSFLALVRLMLPYVLFSAVCLVVLSLAIRPEPMGKVPVEAHLGSRRVLLLSALGFLLCLGGIFKLVPPLAIAAVVAAFLLIVDRGLLASVDYALLGTFLAFFIFTGNLGNVEVFRGFLASVLAGQEELVAVLSSQVISNVPAALLLSGFTDRWDALLVGCNLGGLGTLIASMASLISYKQVVEGYPELKKRYFGWFTLCNVGLLAVLLAAAALL